MTLSMMPNDIIHRIGSIFKIETSILGYYGMRRVIQRTVRINERLLSV